MARNNVQTTVTVGMDVRLAKRNAEALKSIIADLNAQLKVAREAMDNPTSAKAFEEASRKVDELTLKIRTLKKVQSSATPATAYESFISGDPMNSNTLRQAQRGAKNRLNTVKYGTGDQEARQFINDIDNIQKQTNRLQAGFTSPFRTIKQELNNLTGGELQRLLTLLQQEQKLVQGNDKAWANYAEAIAKVEQRMREYDTVAKQQVGAKTLAKSMAGGFDKANERDLQRVIEKLKEYRAVIKDPSGAGRAQWEATTQEIQKQQAALDALKQKAQEYEVIAKRRAGATTLAQSQRGEFATANEADLQRVIEKLKEYRALINDPSGAGKVKWEETTREIIKQEAALDTLKKKMAELKGETMSVANAYRVGLQAGNGTFKGSTQQLALAKKTLQDQLALVERGSKQYKQLQKAIQGCEEEEKRMGMTTKEVQAVLDKPKGKSISELKIAVEQGRMALAKMRTETKEDKKAFDELAAKVKAADFELKQLTGTAKGSASAFDKAWSRLKTYITLYMGAAVAIQKIVGTFGDLMELSDKMGEVRKTTGFTADEVGRLSDSLKKLDTRTTITGLLDLSVAAGQLGLKTQEDVEGFTIAANKLMVALPEMGREGATEMLKVALATGEIDKIRKQMEQGLIDGSSATAVAMEKVGSTIDRLRATSAATAPAITDFVKRVGAVGAQSGISIDQVAALGSTVDALGMRVEMSATALSRMIPAIKNNAFDVAKAIGVTPNTLRELFEAGRGMEAILMIFQHIKDAGMGEDDIEKMLGMGSMKEVMKELNQQGARAGIVFAGLSQNVDELRDHLTTASEAYEENIAIQQEYDKMNETTAAKWERLKNQLEEMFVGASSQRWLGGIIDNLRAIVDFIAADGLIVKGLKIIGIYIAAIKLNLGAAFMGAGSGLSNLWKTIKATAFEMGVFTRATAAAREEYKKLDAATKQNIWGAIAALITYAIVKLVEWNNKVNEARREIGAMANEMIKAEDSVEKNFKAVDKANGKIDEANKKLKESQDALEKARNEMDGTKKSADNLAEAEKNVKKAEDEVKIAKDGHRAAIEKLNKLYSPYLNFVLSEISSKKELANAQEIVNNKLREAIILRQKEAAISRVESDNGEDRDKSYGKLSEQVRALLIGTSTTKTKDKNGKITTTTTKVANTKENEKLLKEITKLAQETTFVELSVSEQQKRVKELLKGTDYENYTSMVGRLASYASIYAKEYQRVNKKVKDVEAQFDAQTSAERDEAQEKLKKQYAESTKTYSKLESDYAKATGNAKKQAAANLLKQADSLESMISGASNYYDLTNEDEKAAYEKFVSDTEKRIDGIKGQREKLLKEAGNLYKPAAGGAGGGGAGGGGGTNPWGGNAPAESTDYATWDVNELVARRNQMDKFKNVLKPDTDIRAVLAEDKALMKALDNELKEDWKSVLGWYNTERKKIQEELKSERFSTNEGHWRDEKQGRSRKNHFRESDYALAELDRYYSKRKEELEKARIKENMSEELFNRQAELLEQEHLERRSKLRETFTAGNTKAEKEMVKQFREWWSKLEKDGKLDEVPWATVESEWAKALASEIGRNNLKAQQDLTQMQQITVNHLNKIADIIAKERPYDGIVDNLRKNLTEMDILFADMEKKGATDAAKLVRAEAERMRFLLGEAENAYALTFDELAKKMRENGLGEWADELMIDDQKKQSIIEALHKVYDDVQNAIKKEAAQIKKNVDIMWQDVMPGQKMSLKDSYEIAISKLGVQQDSVSRANSLIGAGAASERVADKLAIKQLQLKISMQEHYYNLMEQEGRKRIAFLERDADLEKKKAERLKKESEELKQQGKLEEAQLKARLAEEAVTKSTEASLDAQHLTTSLNISQAKELTEIEKQREDIIARTEESQNRLYTAMKEWGDLLASSLQGVFEASHAGDAEYYNELAKLNLTGKGGPGAGTYVVIDDAGTSDATAHYEYLDERQALEREHEIEVENAKAEAWKKLMDDLNAKMNDQITDWVNASLQTAAIDSNTRAVLANTQAIYASMGAAGSSDFSDASKLARNTSGMAVDSSGQVVAPIQPTEPAAETPAWKPFWQMTDEGKAKNAENMAEMFGVYRDLSVQTETEKAAMLAEVPGYTPPAISITDEQIEQTNEKLATLAQKEIEIDNAVAQKKIANQNQVKQGEIQTDKQMSASAKNMYAAMTSAANLYGAAYQAMTNDNLDTEQKFEMIALQAAGQSAMAMMQTKMFKSETNALTSLPELLADCLNINPIAGAAIFAVLSALIGAAIGTATSKLAKGKSKIAQVTGASASAGKLSTGMQTYAEGNVNEFTDPASLTPGRSYNVDGADGKTYRAKYMGVGAKTHITNGPEFHLVGEKGREAIIDAHTTRNIQLNEPEIWGAIKTLYNGGTLSTRSRRRTRRGVAAFADGNIGDFDETGIGGADAYGNAVDIAAMTEAMNRQAAVQEALLERLNQPIVAQNIWHGPEGIPNMYNKMQKEAQRHGEKYL